jgi:hypothetical protein
MPGPKQYGTAAQADRCAFLCHGWNILDEVTFVTGNLVHWAIFPFETLPDDGSSG